MTEGHDPLAQGPAEPTTSGRPATPGGRERESRPTRVEHPLRAILAQPSEPGTNRRGRRLAGALVYLLPDLAPTRIAVTGGRPELVATLRSMADDVVTVDDVPAAHRERATVLWVSGPRTAAAAIRDITAETLPPTVVVDAVDPPTATLAADLLREAGRSVSLFVATSVDGTVRTVRAAAEWSTQEERRQRPSEPVRRLLRTGRTSPASSRVVVGTSAPAVDPAPAWLTALLGPMGLEPAPTTWRIDAPGGYASQKVTVRLEPRERGGSGAIVKLTQDPRYNARLEREVLALTDLAALPELGPLRVPGLLGAGKVGRLQAAVETLVEGRPFSPALREPAGAARLDRAVQGVIGLGLATRRDAAGSDVASALGELVARYEAIHAPSADVRGRLARLVSTIASQPTIPIVATHGDLGTHNLLLAPDDAVVALDWEAYEPDGLPLWDLWYLLRAATLDLDRSRLPRRRLTILRGAFSGTGAANDRLVAATARARRAIPVADELVIPLFALCWVHRALKEAARTDPGAVRRGHFARFAAQILDDLEAPGLRRLQAAVDPS